jgi:CheY-like chemotaxis protein
MEAIGTLTAGIAHDFNNILTAIVGYTELSLSRLQKCDPLRGDLEQVLESGLRATDLVRQILTFSRQTEQERKPVHLDSIIREVLKLLRPSLPSFIEIHTEYDIKPEECIVDADSTQLHQVLMNLCTNAAHAMRNRGGVLSLTLTQVMVDAALVSQHPGLKPGPHLRLAVSDTGHGIDAALMERIFDPYFTTKKTGEGTGMGLAVTMGIVQNHGGAISVSSEAGQGTSFEVFLPRTISVGKQIVETRDVPQTGKEQILFIDDEKALAVLGQKMLETLGYWVTAVTNSHEALELFRSKPDGFDLVITDMSMPGLTGRELARELVAIRPDIPVIMCSGFAEFVNPDQARQAGIREFLMKPYVIGTLAKTIRKVL